MDRSDIPSKIGEYDIDGKLGQGAMGVVYRAHLGDSPVALKVISPQVAEDKEFVHRFLREMQAISTLDHPNIVKAIDFGVDLSQNMYFVALEFIDGMSLQDMLQKRGKLHLQEALEITLQVAKGLDYAYNQGIVHRDIKPDNILIDYSGTAKLADLGLAKSQTAKKELTQTGTILGTPNYVSPEQIEGKAEIDQRADIYSLGCTLFHCLTGKPPYDDNTAALIILNHMTKPIPDPRSLNSDIPPKLAKFTMKMIAKSPEERPQSAREVAEFMEKFLSDFLSDKLTDEEETETVIIGEAEQEALDNVDLSGLFKSFELEDDSTSQFAIPVEKKADKEQVEKPTQGTRQQKSPPTKPVASERILDEQDDESSYPWLLPAQSQPLIKYKKNYRTLKIVLIIIGALISIIVIAIAIRLSMPLKEPTTNKNVVVAPKPKLPESSRTDKKPTSKGPGTKQLTPGIKS